MNYLTWKCLRVYFQLFFCILWSFVLSTFLSCMKYERTKNCWNSIKTTKQNGEKWMRKFYNWKKRKERLESPEKCSRGSSRVAQPSKFLVDQIKSESSLMKLKLKIFRNKYCMYVPSPCIKSLLNSSFKLQGVELERSRSKLFTWTFENPLQIFELLTMLKRSDVHSTKYRRILTLELTTGKIGEERRW